ncbi:hypothetical protein BDZ97DRAFT_1912025 [Flammula alnicola]|nr:hypothetical protein BDZ97DRAFT_1912025 [Flammula alnicola]
MVNSKLCVTDSFLNLAKQGYSAYQESQNNVSKTGGQEYNSPHHSGQDSQDSQGYEGPNIDHDEAIRTAQEQHGSGDSGIYSNAMNFLSNNKQKHTEPIDEERITNAHQQAYGGGDTSDMSAHSMGGAAALQASQAFPHSTLTGGMTLERFQAIHLRRRIGGSGSQTQLISLAMSEATKLFDQSGGAASGNKQDAVNGAAMTVMKLLVQSKFSSAVGGSNSGGLGGLMKLAQQFA